MVKYKIKQFLNGQERKEEKILRLLFIFCYLINYSSLVSVRYQQIVSNKVDQFKHNSRK